MAFSTSTAIFLISLLAIPVTYTINSFAIFHGEKSLLFCGVTSLTFVCGFVYLTIRNKSHRSDPILYVLVLGVFSSVADSLIALENEGVVKGFMSEYLKDGEPYLLTGYGTVLCAWDGVGHLLMYCIILYRLSKNQTFREVGLYWAGSIGHSMIVFIPGNVVGKYGLRWSFLLNIPYIIIPFVCGARFLRERKSNKLHGGSQQSSQCKSIWRRPLDLFFIVGFIYSIVLSLFRGFAVLEKQHSIFTEYINNMEPYLNDPVAYGKIQMLVYLFYYTPYYVMVIYGLLYPGCGWMTDWALLHAGAAAQGQMVHIGASLHHRTPYIMRVPANEVARAVFWTINVFLLVFPQLFAYRCVKNDEYFATAALQRQESQKSSHKKTN